MMLARMPIFEVDPFFAPAACARRHDGRGASVRLREDENAYHVLLVVPGVRTEDIKAAFEEQVLQVSGETKTDHRRAYFDRAVRLPRDADVSSDGVRSVHENGILTISVPKKAAARRELAISASHTRDKDTAVDTASSAQREAQSEEPVAEKDVDGMSDAELP